MLRPARQLLRPSQIGEFGEKTQRVVGQIEGFGERERAQLASFPRQKKHVVPQKIEAGSRQRKGECALARAARAWNEKTVASVGDAGSVDTEATSTLQCLDQRNGQNGMRERPQVIADRALDGDDGLARARIALGADRPYGADRQPVGAPTVENLAHRRLVDDARVIGWEHRCRTLLRPDTSVVEAKITRPRRSLREAGK